MCVEVTVHKVESQFCGTKSAFNLARNMLIWSASFKSKEVTSAVWYRPIIETLSLTASNISFEFLLEGPYIFNDLWV